MMNELSPVLLTSLDRVNELHIQVLEEDDGLKALRLFEDRSRELVFLLLGLTEAVEAQRDASRPKVIRTHERNLFNLEGTAL